MEWQPIETAPSDGQSVSVIGGRYRQAATVPADGEWWRLNAGSLKAVPTHWMPLLGPPDAPKS